MCISLLEMLKRPTEGLHRRMDEIQNRAYGMHNFNNYRLRVKAILWLAETLTAPTFGEEPNLSFHRKNATYMQ